MPEPEQHHRCCCCYQQSRNKKGYTSLSLYNRHEREIGRKTLFRETSGTKEIIEVCPGTAIEREINKKMTQKTKQKKRVYSFETKKCFRLDNEVGEEKEKISRWVAAAVFMRSATRGQGIIIQENPLITGSFSSEKRERERKKGKKRMLVRSSSRSSSSRSGCYIFLIFFHSWPFSETRKSLLFLSSGWAWLARSCCCCSQAPC